MSDTLLDKKTIGFGLSAALMNVFSTLLVIVKEMNPFIKTAMANALGHHWTSHGVVILICFVGFGFILSGATKAENWSANKLRNVIFGSVLLGGAGLAVFYLVH
jgi:hypothetical protein